MVLSKQRLNRDMLVKQKIQKGSGTTRTFLKDPAQIQEEGVLIQSHYDD